MEKYIRISLYAFASFGVSLVIIPLVILLCKKQGWYDTINLRKVHSGSIPRLGSIGFVPVFLVFSFFYLKSDETVPAVRYLPFLAGGILVFILGIIDDFRDLPARVKLIGQCIASILPVLFGFHIMRIGPFVLGIFGPVVTFIWFIGIVNAFNLIDGVDALCGSLSFSILLTLGAVLCFGNSAYTALPFILSGGVLGFLVYNKPKAKIFMGDGGSQFLGFIIAGLPLFKEPPKPAIEYNLFCLTLALVSIPMLDTFAAMWRRKREGRSFFSPDKLHLHHKLMNMGYTTKSILGLLLILQTGICGISLVAVLWLEGLRGFVILCGVLAAMVGFFTIIHYTSHAIARAEKEKAE
ncbi:MAG: undecaprenyl/decaprenyl-phosphate alpha-N-acetylglucosaminyl 1-phosphate transferase [Spirochaetaceae bacterium]|jgi:UDP-GlcNAc:undecaprenyl-phosphate GlcNAc-1-phosphate transferase|nr:undecaprenyl/decaprenyl-phosphate alpha-N-acetylglucosaminyl 1-phosphate transferase [Spirochaetaceae bacterium]